MNNEKDLFKEHLMLTKAVAIGAVALLGAMPAVAQERGRFEFGAFGSHAFFDRRLTLDVGDGIGGHLGYFVTPKWAIELDGSGLSSSRTFGLPDVNVRRLAAGMTFTSMVRHRVSLMYGVGAADTKAPSFHDAGFNSLLGAKIRFSPSTSLRIDRGWTYMMGEKRSYGSWGAGLVVARRGRRTEDTGPATPYIPSAEITNVPAPSVVVTVTPEPTAADLAAIEAARLADSVAAANAAVVVDVTPVAVAPMAPSSAAALAIMTERVHFAYDKSDLSAAAQATLDAKLPIFQANPDMHIVIQGHADERGTDAYNMALGMRRAEAAKAYLISRGINASRISTESKGESEPVMTGTSEEAYAANRRNEFILDAGQYLLEPQP